MNITELKQWIKQCEGLRLKMYADTKGIKTIGYGHNLESGDIPLSVAELLFEHDFNNIVLELSNYSWFVNLPAKVKCGVINMGFHMGLPRLKGFKNMIGYLVAHDYKNAAIEALDSEWARKHKNRAHDVALMIINQD